MFLDNSWNQEQQGFPKVKAVLKAASDEALRRERHELLKGSFDRVFGHNSRKMLTLVDAELQDREAFRYSQFLTEANRG